MGKKIKVTPDELEKAALKLTELSESYTKIYTELLQAAGTMGDAWHGPDNLAFVEQLNGFCEELKLMARRFSTAGETLRRQKDNYNSRIESNIAQARKLAN